EPAEPPGCGSRRTPARPMTERMSSRHSQLRSNPPEALEGRRAETAQGVGWSGGPAPIALPGPATVRATGGIGAFVRGQPVAIATTVYAALFCAAAVVRHAAFQ